MQSAPPATRAAVSRARGALEDVAHVGLPVLLRARRGRRGRGAAGAPRRPPPRPATGSSAPPSWRSRGWRPAARSARRACARGARPPVTSAASRSIFMRPPRPWPSWRRAMSRLISSAVRRRPAGSPSSTQVSPGPCDSPAVISRSSTAPSLFACLRALSERWRDRGRVRPGRGGLARGEHEHARLRGVAQEGQRDADRLAQQLAARLGLGPAAGLGGLGAWPFQA